MPVGLLPNPIGVSRREIQFGTIKASIALTQFTAVRPLSNPVPERANLTIRDALAILQQPAVCGHLDFRSSG
jgi:hypothetical protein